MISAILREAWAVIQDEAQHCQRAFAKNVVGEVVHALDESAVRWDSTGALQKTIGALEGEQFDACMRCLAVGAMRMRMGVLEVNDTGTRAQLETMWSFAIVTAENVERQLSRVFSTPSPA